MIFFSTTGDIDTHTHKRKKKNLPNYTVSFFFKTFHWYRVASKALCPFSERTVSSVR
jgi:hypothetical protein